MLGNCFLTKTQNSEHKKEAINTFDFKNIYAHYDAIKTSKAK